MQLTELLDDQKDEPSNVQIIDPKPVRDPGYWNAKFILINIIILILAIVAAYLQFVAYPALLTAPQSSGGYGETNVVLNLSFLTFRIDATADCGGSTCQLKGVPAFDFFQAMIYLLIIVNVVHFINRRRL
jgi:hypothetical protein